MSRTLHVLQVRRWGRGVAAAFGVTALAAGAVAIRAARAQLSGYAPEHHAVTRPPGDGWAASARDVELPTPGGRAARGWLGASINGAAVVLVDGSDADRTQLLPEAQILARAGYGVLVFDRPGNGESGGERYRADEMDVLRAAVDALAAEPGVRPGAIGAYGFSSGAAFLAEAAASDPRLRGVVLAGCYADAAEYILHFRGRSPVSGYPSLWAAEWAGVSFPHPATRVAEMAPRPLLLVAGELDPTVPPALSERVYAAASQPKELWVVPGAAHGDYDVVAPDAFARRLVTFFDRALLGRP